MLSHTQVGVAQRALDMMLAYAPQRVTFGKPLSSRQTVQNWFSEAATKIHAMRLMTYKPQRIHNWVVARDLLGTRD
jgi:alkylation response protein AidB-like acyl-CoA dehydrogenase